MSSTTPSNPSQLEWCIEARELLRLPLRGGDDVSTAPSMPHRPRLVGDAYGMGYEDYETGDAHPQLIEAVNSGKMISAALWEDLAPTFTAKDLRDFNENGSQIMSQLTKLELARAKDVDLRKDSSAAESQMKAMDKSLEYLTQVKEGSPLLPFGSIGFPEADFESLEERIKGNLKAIGHVIEFLENLDPSHPGLNNAKKLADEWYDYWNGQRNDLTKAMSIEKKEGIAIGFDPAFRTAPSDTLDLSAWPDAPNLLGNVNDDGDEGPCSPLKAPSIHIERVLTKEFQPAIDAAKAKLAAMREMQKQLEKVPSRDPSQRETLSLVNEWVIYWTRIQSRLEVALKTEAVEVDLKDIEAPAGRPSVDGAIEAAWVKRAEAAMNMHNSTEIAPIKEAMRKCLPMLDAPQNNPERIRVGAALERFSAVDVAVETEEDAEKKAAGLAALERELAAWNDRRSRMYLPPAAEAVAMADLVQAAHRKFIDELIEHKLDLPIPGLADDELADVQRKWTAILGGTGPLKIDGGFHPPNQAQDADKTDDAAVQFRSETLANFARLLTLPWGRKLVSKLEASKVPVHFCAGERPECYAEEGSEAWRPRMPETDAEVQTEEDAHAHKGKGTSSTITIMRGAKDSQNSMCTAEGSPIHTPSFIAMAHEMIHALHNARGANRRELPLKEDAIWSNSEELKTINLGKLSEQTLRAEYGLSAERFGHGITRQGGAVAKAFADALALATAQEEHAADRQEIRQRLTDLGFTNLDAMTDHTLFSIRFEKPELRGPFPADWDANHLSLSQMRKVLQVGGVCNVQNPLPSLGWSPFDLEPNKDPCNRLVQVIESREAHPRSRDGLRFRSLGGKKGLDALAALKSSDIELTGLLDIAWDAEDWPSKLVALENANVHLDKLLSDNGKGLAVKGAVQVKMAYFQKNPNNTASGEKQVS